MHRKSSSLSGESTSISITSLPPTRSIASPPSHHVGSPPIAFTNPWPSFRGKHSFLSILQTRFSHNRNFVPVPDTRDELVKIRKPDWGGPDAHGLKATWIGHASFLVETPCAPGKSRGVRLLFDPVFSDRTSPVGFLGPKRFSPTPCSIADLPEVDAVVISHNHYDHLDLATVKQIYSRRKGQVHFFCALGQKSWFQATGIEEATELDWWDGVRLDVRGVGSVNLTCTPAQHMSGRTPWDAGTALWCSWVLAEGFGPDGEAGNVPQEKTPSTGQRLFFAGDTGYRSVTEADSTVDESSLPYCPAFAEIGDTFGPFDLALLPIGCCTPRGFMSPVHCTPEDSICVHKDIRSKKSIGMHYGTVRGGLSAQYEDVRDPPRRWKAACEKEGLVWGKEIGLCDIGETVTVE